MNDSLAEHVSLLAAPIYAAMILVHQHAIERGEATGPTAESIREMKQIALMEAFMLWQAARDFEA